MKITKKHLKIFHDKVENIVDAIQELADECSMEEGETDLAESLWIAQSELESARQSIDI